MGLLRMPSVKVPAGSPPVSDAQESFVGGENKKAASSIAPLDQVAAMTNVRVIREGELAKRPGLRRVMATATGFLPGMRLYPSTLNLNRVLGVDTAKHVRYCTLSGSAATKVDIADLATAFQPGLNCAEFRDGSGDVVYIGTASGGMLKWDGATTITEGVASGIVTGIGTVWVYNQRLFAVAGVPPYFGAGGNRSSTIYWSGLNNGDTLGDTSSGGGSANVRTYGGDLLVGGFALGGSNFLLHENAISVFRGTTFDDINITAGTEGLSPNIGLPLGWRVIDQIAYLVTANGAYRIIEGIGCQPIGTPEFPDPIRQFLLANGATTSNGYAVRVLHNTRRREVWFLLNGTTVFIYSIEFGRFTGQCTFPFAVVGAEFKDVNDEPVIVFVRSTGALYVADFTTESNNVYQDHGTNYASSVTLRRMYSQEDPAAVKSWRRAMVQMGSGAGLTPLTVGATTGAIAKYVTASGSVTSTTSLLAQQATTVELSGQGSFVDLTITDNGTISVGWSVLRAEVEGFGYPRR